MIDDILAAPFESPLILGFTIAYVVVAAIRIYDARLIQAKTRGFYSGVAADAEGRFLPPWVGIVHWAGWILFGGLLFLNWKYAIALYFLLFLLRVVPVLEWIGAVIMRPFLQSG